MQQDLDSDHAKERRSFRDGRDDAYVLFGNASSGSKLHLSRIARSLDVQATRCTKPLVKDSKF